MNVHFASVSKPPHAMLNGHSSPPKFESLNLQVSHQLQLQAGATKKCQKSSFLFPKSLT